MIYSKTQSLTLLLEQSRGFLLLDSITYKYGDFPE
jgi:hypothetical protein